MGSLRTRLPVAALRRIDERLVSQDYEDVKQHHDLRILGAELSRASGPWERPIVRWPTLK
jgi:hypothetical protein